MRQKSRVSELAERAEVSVATVSRIVSGRSRVSRETSDRVRKAALELGIDLRENSKSRTIAFVLGNREVLHSFHSRILSGAEDQCQSHGWDLLFLSFRYSANIPSKDLHLPPVMRRRDVAGAVILAGTNSENLLLALKRQGTPFSILGNNIIGQYEPERYDIVYGDDTQGAYEMTRYLLLLNHKNISFVGNLSLPWYARCEAGYSRAMKEAGHPPNISAVDSTNDEEVGYLGTKAILARREVVTAIFAGTDPAAQGAYKALSDSGLRIPQDVSLVGCNDTCGVFLHPPLTTINEYPQQLGRQLVELALNRTFEPDRPAQQVTVPTQLLKRESCLQLAPPLDWKREPLDSLRSRFPESFPGPGTDTR